jgi:diguanylate cyclase (GGDEF)-like protein
MAKLPLGFKMSKKDTLIDRLNDIVDKVHIDEVKEIINKLTQINLFKHSIEDNLSIEILYKKIAIELQKEFSIECFKISLLSKKDKEILYEQGDLDKHIYSYKSKVSNESLIEITVADNSLSPYNKLTLNSYFKETMNLIYIQYILFELKNSSLVDPQTQLENRISFNLEMKTLIPLALREKMNIGALLINIDRFQAVNDEHGDQFGDAFLKLYADTIKENIRSSDIAVRFGGAEFLVLLVNVDTEDRAIMLANNLREKLAQTYLLSPNNDKFKKTVCVGVSMFPEDSKDINQIVKNAETALISAQDLGRNRVFRFKEEEENFIELF